jgi:hypothetical protein
LVSPRPARKLKLSSRGLLGQLQFDVLNMKILSKHFENLRFIEKMWESNKKALVLDVYFQRLGEKVRLKNFFNFKFICNRLKPKQNFEKGL